MNNNSTQVHIPDVDETKPLNNKKQGIFALVVVGIVIIGLILHAMGVFKSEKSTVAENNLGELNPPNAVNKDFSDRKYTEGQVVNKNISINDGVGDLADLTGRKEVEHTQSNEALNENDYKKLEKNDPNIVVDNPKKAAIRDKLKNDLRREQAAQNYIAKEKTPLFKKTREDYQLEAKEAEDRNYNRRATELMLTNIEQYQKSSLKKDSLMPVIANQNNKAKVNSDLDNELNKVINNNMVTIIPDVEKNTTGNAFAKKSNFFGVSTKKQSFYSRMEGIEAVVHANADEAIKVSQGTIIKLRLLSETKLKINGETIILPRNTFINAEATITNNRLNLTSSALRINNAIYPLSFVVYDIDGLKGLNIPNLEIKTQTYQQLGTSGASSLNGGGLFTSGSVAQQVGTQMAIQTAQSGLQVGRQLLQNKASRIIVTIKPNHKVILKSENLNNNDEN